MLENGKRKVFCSFCPRDTTRHTYVVCRKCDNKVLCLVCMRRGMEGAGHVATHPYSVVQRLNFSVKSPDWTARQELLLMEAIEKFGFGNWGEIANHVGPKKERDVEEHFAKCYPLKSLPPSHLPKKAKKFEKNGVAHSPTKSSRLSEQLWAPDTPVPRVASDSHSHVTFDRSANSGRGPAPVNGDRPLRNLHFDPIQLPAPKTPPFKTLLDRKLEALAPIIKLRKDSGDSETQNGPVCQSRLLLGYEPYRDELDIEYNNDAELYLADMEFRSDESPEDLRTKFEIFEVYNAKKEEREKRKQFMIEHRLFDLEAMVTFEKNATNEERVFGNLLRPQLQFLSASEAQEFQECHNGLIKFEKFRHQVLGSRKLDQDKLQVGLAGRDLGRLTECAKTILGGGSYRKTDQFSFKRAGGNLLDTIFNEEVELCQVEGIPMDDFLAIKDQLIRRWMLEGPIDPRKALEKTIFEKRAVQTCLEFLAERNLVEIVDVDFEI